MSNSLFPRANCFIFSCALIYCQPQATVFYLKNIISQAFLFSYSFILFMICFEGWQTADDAGDALESVVSNDKDRTVQFVVFFQSTLKRLVHGNILNNYLHNFEQFFFKL